MQKEALLQHIWKFGLFDRENLHTSDGSKVQVIALGTQNTDEGPDFLNAKIQVDDTVWAGSIEVHTSSSDWYKHKHSENKKYNSVILHVVAKNDDRAVSQNGVTIPTVVLSYPAGIEERYNSLISSNDSGSCAPFIKEVDSFRLRHFLSRLLVERLEARANSIKETLQQTRNDWQQVFYRLLFRSFGFGVNVEPFELLAQKTPPQVIAKHRSSLFQLEALLFGQSGFLDGEPADSYQGQLQKEYAFLQNKFNLQPIDSCLWKFLRLRPGNFPTIRLAQVLHNEAQLIDKVESCSKLEEYATILAIATSDYWETHYMFGKQSPAKVKTLGRQSVERIVTNALVPYLFSYGMERGSEQQKEKALNLLEELPAEKNSAIERWDKHGFKAESSFYSQALLQLKKEYCDKKRCLACIVGKQMLHPKQIG